MNINTTTPSPKMSKAALRVKMYEDTPKMAQLMRLANAIGDFIHYWGFKRVHGQVWTLLFLAEQPLSGAQLANRLKVSKALISLILQELVEYDLIQQVPTVNRRIKAFEAKRDVIPAIRKVLLAREMPLLQKIASDFTVLKRLDKEHKDERGAPLQPRLSTQRIVELEQMVQSGVAAITLLTQVADFNELSPLVQMSKKLG